MIFSSFDEFFYLSLASYLEKMYTGAQFLSKFGVETMTRMSKQAKRRAKCPKKRLPSFALKTGPKKDNLSEGYRVHENTAPHETCFIPKVR